MIKKMAIGIALSATLAYVPQAEASRPDLGVYFASVPAVKVDMIMSTGIVSSPDKEKKRRREAGSIGRQIGREATWEIRRRVPDNVRRTYDDIERTIRDIEGAVREGKRRGENQFPPR